MFMCLLFSAFNWILVVTVVMIINNFSCITWLLWKPSKIRGCAMKQARWTNLIPQAVVGSKM